MHPIPHDNLISRESVPWPAARSINRSALSLRDCLCSDGDGSVYWSVTAHDAGSLPLITAALDRALLLWGHPQPAAARVEFYLNTYIRNSSGLTPQNHAGQFSMEKWADFPFKNPDLLSGILISY